MQTRLLSVCLIVSCLLVGCGAPTPVPTFPVPQATQPSYPVEVLPPTSLPQGYPAATPVITLVPQGYPVPAQFTYKDFEITPSTLAVTAGTEVQFVIESASGALHQPYSDSEPNTFEAPADVADGGTFNFTFAQPGTVTLLCKVHPEMRATLTVTP